jgi:hypothetical protein
MAIPRIVPEVGRSQPVESEHFTLQRIARALERIADRLDHDAQTFDEMVEEGRTVSAGAAGLRRKPS